MANPIAQAWRKLFYHEGNRYFLLPPTNSASPSPPNEGPFGEAWPSMMTWLGRLTYGGRVPTPLFYTIIGVVLALLTGLEVWLFTLKDTIGGSFVTIMLLLALFKFIIVVAFFMHLRFEKSLLSWVFASGLFIAVAIFVLMLTIQGQLIPEPLVAS